MNPGISFPKMIENWSELKGLYRFFTNKKVTHKNILLPHKAKTVERCMEEDTVLFVQDTTYLNYAHHSGTMGLGLIGKEKSLIGMIVHNGYAVSGRDKKPLGLLQFYLNHMGYKVVIAVISAGVAIVLSEPYGI